MKAPGLEETYKKALVRIERIQSHLTTAARGGKLKDKVCIITGVGSLKGIGRSAALLFAHEGAKHLYLIDIAGQNLPQLKETIKKLYPDVVVTTIQADSADETAISNVCDQALREEGRLDVFFANAGIGSFIHMKDTSVKHFMETMRVNVLGTFLAIKYASKAMAVANPSRGKHDSEGSIIVTSSIAGFRSFNISMDYSASKAALINMVQTSIYQLQRTNIRVNAISPGLIETGLTGDMFSKFRDFSIALGQLNPLARHGTSEEIAQVALFLASDDSSYINGQNIPVDGGFSASLPTVAGKMG